MSRRLKILVAAGVVAVLAIVGEVVRRSSKGLEPSQIMPVASGSIGPPDSETPRTAVRSDADVTVYVTDTGDKYHHGSCRHLDESKHALSLLDARAGGYGPCRTCAPPK